MASGGGSSSSSKDYAGSLSPVMASLWQLFAGGPAVGIRQGAYVPTAWGGGALGPQTFAALPELAQNQPLTGTEQALLGATWKPGGPPRQTFDQLGYQKALMDWSTRMSSGMGEGPGRRQPDPTTFLRTETPAGQWQYGGEGGWADLASTGALQGQGLLEAGIPGYLAAMNPDPSAQIALARRGFERETLPALAEYLNPAAQQGSDWANTLSQAGVDLETNIAALREGALDRVLQATQGAPAYAGALGSNLLEQGAAISQFGQMGREFIRGTSEGGDALRMMELLQALSGPALANVGKSSSKGGQGSVLWG